MSIKLLTIYNELLVLPGLDHECPQCVRYDPDWHNVQQVVGGGRQKQAQSSSSSSLPKLGCPFRSTCLSAK